MNKAVAKKFQTYPEQVRKRMLGLRQLILDTAAKMDEVGGLEETLKWGEPAYLNQTPRTGTTLRIDWKSRNPEYCSIFVNCQTDLLEMFRLKSGNRLQFEGQRAIHLPLKGRWPRKELRDCIKLILTYHKKK